MNKTRNSLLGRTADITVNKQYGTRNIGHKNVRYTVKTGCFTAEKDLPKEKQHTIYIMGAESVSDEFRGTILSTIRRPSGQLLFAAAPEGVVYCEAQIRECLGFYERQHRSDFEFYMSVFCGMILIKDYGDRIRFLLAQDKKTGKISFIKDRISSGESEKNASLRIIYDNTGIRPELMEDFSTEYMLGTQDNRKHKIIVFLGQYREKVIRMPEDCPFRTVNLEFDKAMKSLDDPQERILLMEARDYYDNRRKGVAGLQQA